MVGKPIRPMLAERLESAQAILDRSAGLSRRSTSWTARGCRCTRTGERVELFSRRLERITDNYPDVVDYVRGTSGRRRRSSRGRSWR